MYSYRSIKSRVQNTNKIMTLTSRENCWKKEIADCSQNRFLRLSINLLRDLHLNFSLYLNQAYIGEIISHFLWNACGFTATYTEKFRELCMSDKV